MQTIYSIGLDDSIYQALENAVNSKANIVKTKSVPTAGFGINDIIVLAMPPKDNCSHNLTQDLSCFRYCRAKVILAGEPGNLQENRHYDIHSAPNELVREVLRYCV